jgi:1-deoxy-D-xylulose-5-phosphate reductoisomerase
MDSRPRKIVVLGSTGSIGQNTLEVVKGLPGQFEIVGLSAHQRLQDLCQQAQEWTPRYVIATDPKAAQSHDWSGLPGQTKLLIGPEEVERIVGLPDVDLVVSAVVGSAGLTGTWAAVQAGKTIALANKETLVMAGAQVMPLAAQRHSQILPVDSEHSGIFQLLDGNRCHANARAVPEGGGNESESSSAPIRSFVKRIILTASGGPFRTWSKEAMALATIDDALSHPTWRMGRKITIDSATMMNKALEIIEARWLFDLPPERIDVVVHPQSIVHSLVEFVDGSVVAQLSPPDMKLPIQYALTFPNRAPSPARKLNLNEALRLDFEPPDPDRFPALALGREVAAAGGTAGAVLNAANEAAVAQFLSGRIAFSEIVPACQAVLETHTFSANPTLDELLCLDAWARQEIQRWILA